jgi:type VI protein secretion system component Hcp
MKWCVLCLGVVASVLKDASLWASPAKAQNFSLTLQLGPTLYNLQTFSWGPNATSTGQGISNELTFAINPNFASSVDLLTQAESGQTFATAELQDVFLPFTVSSVTVVDIQLTNITIESAQIRADINAIGTAGSPVEIVTLKFESVTYTFQPYLPNGLKNGPAVTFSTKFKK